jgi:hypothetical protein
MVTFVQMKKWAFPALLALGVLAFVGIVVWEEWPYSGPTAEILGKVQRSEYVHGGAASGRSFTRIKLEDGRTFRLPVGEVVSAHPGDEIYLVVSESMKTGVQDVPVVSFKLIRGTQAVNPLPQ